jgi:hypothetical protein
VLFESDGLPVKNRMLVVVAAYSVLALGTFVLCRYLLASQNALGWAFLAVSVFSAVMAAALLVQTRNIGSVVAFEHGILIPYHASHPVPFFQRYNKVVPWIDIIGIERSHGLRVILADGRDFLVLLHHDGIDELESLIRRKLSGK